MLARRGAIMKVLVILGKGLKERGADVESARVFGTLLLADYEVLFPLNLCSHSWIFTTSSFDP